MITWNNSDEPPTFSRKYNEWIYPEKPKSELKFIFKREPDVVHWMLCEMKQMGWNEKAVSVKKQGMRIAEVGTFNKEDMTLLKKYIAEQRKKSSTSEWSKKEIVRVKAKR